MNKAKALGGLASILAGVGLGKKIYDKHSLLTGRENMFHNTASKNVEQILEQGLLASKASDPDNFTNLNLKVNKTPISKKDLKNKVYLAKNKDVIDSFEGSISYMNHDQKTQDPRLTLNISIPIWRFKESKNPIAELLIDRIKEGRGIVRENRLYRDIELLHINKGILNSNKRELKAWGPKGTAVIEGDVGPEYIKESPHYKKLSIPEIKDYIKNNPGKFTKGALGVAGSLGLMVGGGGLLRSALKKTASKGDDNMNKVAMYKEEIVKMASLENFIGPVGASIFSKFTNKFNKKPISNQITNQTTNQDYNITSRKDDNYREVDWDNPHSEKIMLNVLNKARRAGDLIDDDIIGPDLDRSEITDLTSTFDSNYFKPGTASMYAKEYDNLSKGQTKLASYKEEIVKMANNNFLFTKKNWNQTDENLAHSLSNIDRYNVAKKTKYDGILIDFSYDKNDNVRLGVAKNQNTPLDVLKRMSLNDKSFEVRAVAATTLKKLNQ